MISQSKNLCDYDELPGNLIPLLKSDSFFTNLFYLFIFGCVGSSLLHAGFLQLQRAGATLRCGARASVAVSRGLSSCVSWAPEHRLSSCGARAQLLCSMWDLPGPGLEPVSPALAGGFLTTVPPGKPLKSVTLKEIFQILFL